MKGNKSAEEVRVLDGDYLKDGIYMQIVKLDKPNAKEQLKEFITGMNPVAFELLFSNDSKKLDFELKEILDGHSLICYNTFVDTIT